jgi:hypothetical protein
MKGSKHKYDLLREVARLEQTNASVCGFSVSGFASNYNLLIAHSYLTYFK